MGYILESVFTEIVCCIILALLLLYWYMTKHYDYWEARGVPCAEPEFPYGSTKELILTNTFLGKGHADIYRQFSRERYYGIIEFGKPVFFIRDPELVKRVMVKDFQHFSDRPVVTGASREYINLHLLNLTGKEWKDMRMKLTPTFTSGKMKAMFGLMEKCSERLRDVLESETEDGKCIDAKSILSRFTLEIIGSCAFGLDTNSLTDKNAEFFHMFKDTVKLTTFRYIRRLFVAFFPWVIPLLRHNFVPPYLRDFCTNVVRDTVKYRKTNSVKRNDFIDLLINIKNNKDVPEENGNTHTTSDGGLTIEQMTAQSFIFLIAGFETASSLMTFCLYELSRHHHIQEKLHREIQDAVSKNDGKVSYQILMEVPFLEQVINETLRLYGTAHVISRKCTQQYTIPDSDVVLEKGIKVVIPVFALHHDPDYFPDPYEFKPERFTQEECKKRHPYVFLPFGEGPRNCIGMRFGLMQAKVGLATVILNFRVDLSPQQEVPIEIDRQALLLIPANPVFLTFAKRTSLQVNLTQS